MPRSVPLACAALLTLAAPAVQAAATAETGTALVTLCQTARTAPDTPDALKCTAYLIGLFDALRTFSANTRDPLICPPQRLEDAQFAEAYLRWAQYNPRMLDRYPAGGAVEALVQAFSCQR